MSDALREDPDNGDQVARQRRKRAAGLLDRSVTLDDVVRSVIAAIDECDGPLDVDQFLTERGHAWQTIEMVRACITFVDRHVAAPPVPPLR
jgi:hypothetical protein